MAEISVQFRNKLNGYDKAEVNQFVKVAEAKLQETFEKLSCGRTTIIIAHRLSTVRNADRIAVVSGGEIVEEGSHTELLEKGGEYASLYELQFRGNS